MKLEIEITEAEIRSAIEREVRTAVADASNAWSSDDYIKKEVKAQWGPAVDTLIAELLASSASLREKIAAEIERKLRAQIGAALKNAAKDTQP